MQICFHSLLILTKNICLLKLLSYVKIVYNVEKSSFYKGSEVYEKKINCNVFVYLSCYWRDSNMRSWLNSTATARKAILMSALLQVSKRMTTQFQNLPRMQIRIGMSAPSKAFSSPSARGIQMTENTLTLPSLFILFKRHEATLKIWLLSFAARDTQKVSRANSSMMSNNFDSTL